MGETKQLLLLGGKPLLQHVIDAAAAADQHQVVLVLGASHEAILDAINAERTDVVVNADHAKGQSTSLRAGLAAVRAEIGRAVILLGDQPEVSAETIGAVARAPGGPIVRATYRGEPSHPTALDRAVWPLLAASGDHGARDLIASRPELVRYVEIDTPPPPDIDTPEDFRRATSRR
jgi:molybdenum cofactor cytidylyltransferase